MKKVKDKKQTKKQTRPDSKQLSRSGGGGACVREEGGGPAGAELSSRNEVIPVIQPRRTPDNQRFLGNETEGSS